MNFLCSMCKLFENVHDVFYMHIIIIFSKAFLLFIFFIFFFLIFYVFFFLIFYPYVTTIFFKVRVQYIFDTCHKKIDLFRVQNIVIHELSWQKCSQAHQPGKFFSEWLSDFWLFWYQINCSSSNRTHFTHVWRPKNCPFFEPRRGLFSRDTRH